MLSKISEQVRTIVELLVNKDYLEVERITSGVRLSAKDIEGAIHDYGRILSVPPLSEYDKLDIIEITNSKLPSWSIRMNLWTWEEGKSDLSIELTIIEKKGNMVVELDDIHVF